MIPYSRKTFEKENFCKLVENTIFTKKTFTDCSQALPMATIPLNFTEKTFTNILKTTKFAKVFSLESFLLSREKTFADYSLMQPTDATPLNFIEKTFTNSHKGGL